MFDQAGGALTWQRSQALQSATQNPNNVVPGHLPFSGQGVALWANDVVTFFNSHRPISH
jgi:hypothetical protein